MKRQNYYQVHKNKKPRLAKKKINWHPIYKAIFSSMEVVRDLTVYKRNRIIQLSQLRTFTLSSSVASDDMARGLNDLAIQLGKVSNAFKAKAV